MRLESLVVLVLILLISYFSLRGGRRGAALAALPLVILPIFNLMGGWVAPQLARMGGTPVHWRVLFVVAGMLVQGALLGAISRAMGRKSTRRTYLGMCGGFSVVFAFLIIFEILPFTG